MFFIREKNEQSLINLKYVIFALAIVFSLYVSNGDTWYYIFLVLVFFGIFSWIMLRIKGVIIILFIILLFLIWKHLFLYENVKSWYISSFTRNISFVKIIRNAINDFFDNNYGNTDSNIFFKMIFLNEKNYSSPIYYSLKDLSLIHIFTVSGFHLNLLFSIITFLNKKSKSLVYIGLSLCTFYSILLGLTCGVLRSLLCLIFKQIPLVKNFKDSERLSLCCIFICILQPNVVYDVGFQLSFITTSCCYLKIFKNNKILNSFIISFFIFLITLPVMLSFNNKLNLLSFVMNLIYSPLFV